MSNNEPVIKREDGKIGMNKHDLNMLWYLSLIHI